MVMLRGFGRRPQLPTMKEVYGLNAAAIAILPNVSRPHPPRGYDDSPTRQNRVHLSTDGGAAWHLINKGLPGNPPDAYFVVAGQASAEQFYVYVMQHGLFEPHNDGASWRNITSPGQSQINMQTLFTDPADPNRLLLGTGAEQVHSADDGKTGTQISAVQGTLLALAAPAQ